MKKFENLILLSLGVIVFFAAGCATDDAEDVEKVISSAVITANNASGDAEGDVGNRADNKSDILANSSFTTIVNVTYSGNSAEITGTVDGVTATVDNGDVTIASSAEGIQYVLTGTTSDGSFKLYSEKKCQITLNGVNLANSDGPALNIQPYNDDSGRVFVVLNAGTENTLSDGKSYTSVPGNEDAKGTVFAEGKLIFSGTGSLTVKGNYKHGIVSDDYVRVTEGTITIADAVKDGIHTNDAIIIDGGTFNINVSSDGMDAEEGYIVINGGTFNINATDDGIDASYDLTEAGADQTVTPYVTINGGTFVIQTTGGEGIESKSVLTINGGDFTVKTADDGLNAISDMYINGGNLYVYSTSNDAIDTNGKLTVTGGQIVAIGANQPEGAFDCDNNSFKITGGILVGIGGATSSPTANVCTQNSVILGSAASANQLISILSSEGKEALTFLVPKAYSAMLFSSPKLESNATYSVYTGGSVANGVHFNGLYTSGTYSGGTSSGISFTTSGRVTRVGVNTGPGPGMR